MSYDSTLSDSFIGNSGARVEALSRSESLSRNTKADHRMTATKPNAYRVVQLGGRLGTGVFRGKWPDAIR